MEFQKYPTRTHQIGDSRSHCVPVDVTASRKDSAYRPSDEDVVISRPMPPFREVPVNVTRKTGPPVAALPPPSNRQQNNITPKRTSSRRHQKRTTDGGNGSDSDSDHNERRLADADDSDAQIRKKRQEKRILGQPRGKTTLTEPRRPLLSMVGGTWAEMSQLRQGHRANAKKFLRLVGTYSSAQLAESALYDIPPVLKHVVDADELLQVYLDDVLYMYARDWTSEDTSALRDDMEDIIVSVEEHILSRCESPGRSELHDMPRIPRYILLLRSLSILKEEVCLSNEVQREGSFLKELCTHPCGHAKGSMLPVESERCDESSARGTEQATTLTSRTSQGIGGTPVDSTKIDAQYRVFDMAVRNSLQSLRPAPIVHRRLNFVEKIIMVIVHHYWEKVTSRLRHSVMLTLVYGSSDHDWLGFIEQSRQHERLTPRYIDWVTAGVNTAKLQNLRLRWRTRKVVNQWKDQMVDIGARVSQEFCQDLAKPGTVSLLLVENDRPIGIKEVSFDDLERSGWYRETQDHKYWRCKPTGDKKPILKEDMSGRVLGLFGLEPGSQDWIFIEHQLGFQKPQARAITQMEKTALGIPQ